MKEEYTKKELPKNVKNSENTRQSENIKNKPTEERNKEHIHTLKNLTSQINIFKRIRTQKEKINEKTKERHESQKETNKTQERYIKTEDKTKGNKASKNERNEH